MDQPHDERDATSATRSQNVVYTLAHDWGAIPTFIAPALERLDRAAGETQLLVVTADAETALAVADAALAMRDDPDARPALIPVTRPERAARLMRAGAPAAVAGTPDVLAALVRSAALKLGGVRTLVLAWADDIAATADAASLEAVLTEVPKDAARVLVAAEQTEAVDALIERYLRRPRHVAQATPPAVAPRAVSLGYVLVTPAARPAALRRVLDELDPASAAIVVGTDAGEAEARRVLRGLGYHATTGEPNENDAAAAFGADVRVTRGNIPGDVALAVLYDAPADRAALDRVLGGRPSQIVALAQPRQLAALRALAGGPVTPLALADLARGARSRDDALRAELRATLEAGVPHRELLALEPLLDSYDGVQLAAAALRLLEQSRAATAAAASAAPGGHAVAPQESASGMTRLFITVGNKDGVRPGDLVGAISGESGIKSDRIGKIEVRDAFSLVEVASADAARVIEKVNGISIRGRRVNVRPEREQGARPERGDRKGPAGDRRGPPDKRVGGGGERRPPRTFDRSDGPRGFGAADDRGVRERTEQRDEWAARADQLRNARRARPEQAPNDPPASDAGTMDSDEG